MKIVIHDPLISDGADDARLPSVRADPESTVIRAAPVGTTPVCWRHIDDTLHLAAQPADLARLEPRPAPDESVLQSLLTWDFPPHDGSPFQGIHRVPGGCQVRLNDRASRMERWWTMGREPPGPSRPIEIWNALVRQCTEDLEGATRGAVMLSGGIDSAAIAAASAVAARNLGQPQPLLLGAAYPGLDCDERPMQEAVARHLTLPQRIHDATSVPLWPPLESAVRESLSPLVDGQEGINLDLYRAAREQGCDVVLHGIGGDELFEGRGLEVDLVRRGSWIKAARFVHSGLEARPSPALRTWIRRGLRNPLSPERMGPTRFERMDAGSWSRAVLRWTLAQPGLDWRLEMAERTARRAGLHFSAPYLGRSMLEAVQRVSFRQLASGGTVKGALREAVAPYLPESVVRRIAKARFTAYYQFRLAIEGPAMIQAYGELAKVQKLSWLPRKLAPLSQKPAPQEFLPLWMGLAILLFVDSLSTTTRRID